jgi:hypothetical protein
MFDFGVVDPTKVVRSALQNAASVACLLLTTDSKLLKSREYESLLGHRVRLRLAGEAEWPLSVTAKSAISTLPDTIPSHGECDAVFLSWAKSSAHVDDERRERFADRLALSLSLPRP